MKERPDRVSAVFMASSHHAYRLLSAEVAYYCLKIGDDTDIHCTKCYYKYITTAFINHHHSSLWCGIANCSRPIHRLGTLYIQMKMTLMVTVVGITIR